MLNHIGTKELETDRLLLRPFTQEDAADMYNNWASDDEATRFLTWPTHSEVKITEGIVAIWVERYKEPSNYHWAIMLKDTGQIIGSISMMNIDDHNECCEVGYCIGKAWWNQGITTEALNEIIRFSFHEVGFNRLTARHDSLNTASGAVMIKCGMIYEGTLRQVLMNKQGKLVDCKLYSILRDEYTS